MNFSFMALISWNSFDVLDATVAGQPFWLYVAGAVWILLTVLAVLATGWILKRFTKRLAARTNPVFAEKIHSILRTPLKIVAVMVMLNLGVRVCGFPNVTRLVDIGLVIAVAIAVLRAAMQLVDMLLERASGKLFRDDPQLAAVMLPVLSKTLKGFIIVIGGLTVAQYFGLPVASVLAGLGVGGIAVALAAQNTLANFFGAFVIMADRPFRIGDLIKIDAIEGKVETIGLRSTRIRTANGDLVTIPNKNVADNVVVNRTPRN